MNRSDGIELYHKDNTTAATEAEIGGLALLSGKRVTSSGLTLSTGGLLEERFLEGGKKESEDLSLKCEQIAGSLLCLKSVCDCDVVKQHSSCSVSQGDLCKESVVSRMAPLLSPMEEESSLKATKKDENDTVTLKSYDKTESVGGTQSMSMSSSSFSSRSGKKSTSKKSKRRHRHQALFDNLDKTMKQTQTERIADDASMCFAAMALVFTSNQQDDNTQIHRPFVPLPVVRMLWTFLLRTRRHFDNNNVMARQQLEQIEDALITSLSFLDRTTLPDAPPTDDDDDDEEDDEDELDQQNHIYPKANIVDAVPNRVASANIDIDFHLDHNDNNNTSTLSDQQQTSHHAPQNHFPNNHHVAQIEQDEDDAICLRINHDIHHLYGIYIAKTRPHIFIIEHDTDSSQTAVSSSSSTWNPEKQLNNDMVQACLDAIQTHDLHMLSSSSSEYNLDPSSMHGPCQYDYAVEMLPWHMMRCGQYKNTALLLCTSTFVKRRFTTLGLYEGTKMHVADVEELHLRLVQTQSQDSSMGENVLVLKHYNNDDDEESSPFMFDNTPKGEQHQEEEEPYIDVQDLFLTSYKTLQTVLKTQDQMVPLITANNTLSNSTSIANTSSSSETPSHNNNNASSLIANNSALLLQTTIEIAKSYHCLGASLSSHSHNLNTDAMKYYSRALVQIEKSHAALSQNPHSASYLSSISTTHNMEEEEEEGTMEDCTIDTVQYLMAETLFAMATLHDTTKNYTSAMLCYERALAFYSRQTQLRHSMGVAKTLANMGIVHYHLKEMKNAESCFEESLSLWRSLQSQQQQQQQQHGSSGVGGEGERGDHSIASQTALVETSSYNKTSDSSTNTIPSSSSTTTTTNTNINITNQQPIGDEEISDLLQWMANVRRETNQYDDAMSHLQEALYAKILSVGRNHPEVALIHHSMGVVHDDMSQFDKSMKSYEEAVRIRRMVLGDVRKNWRRIRRMKGDPNARIDEYYVDDDDDVCDYSYIFCGHAEEEELAVAETLRCMGNVSAAQGKKWDAYCRLWECAMIHRSRVGYYLDQGGAAVESSSDNDSGASSAAASTTTSCSFVFFTSRKLANLITVDVDNAEEEHSSLFAMQHMVEDALENLKMAIEACRHFLPGGSEEVKDDEHFLLDLMGQVADMLYDRGIIHGSRYICLSEGKNGFGDAEEERKLSVKDLSQSILFRKERIKIRSMWGAKEGAKQDPLQQQQTKGEEEEDETLSATEDDQILIAFTYYEMGKLYCTKAQKAMKRRGSREGLKDLVSNNKSNKTALKNCHQAVHYFEEAHSIMWKNLDLIDSLETEVERQDQGYDNDNVDNEEVVSTDGDNLPFVGEDIRNPVYVRVQHIPSALEEMLGTMGVLYTHLKKYEKAVECYNKVSIILSRVGFGGNSGDNGSTTSNDSITRKLQQQKERVALSIHSIGDILFETGDNDRALQSYKEALRLRRSICDRSRQVAETLFALGDVQLERREFDDALKRYDEALEVRLELVGENHPDVAFCYHRIGKVHEALDNYEEALKSYKSAMEVVRSTSSDDVIVSKEGRHWSAVTKLDAIDIADIYFDVGRVLLLLERGTDTIAPSSKKEQYKTVIACLSQALEKYQEAFDDDCVEVANTSSLMGEAYDRTGQYEKAISSFDRSLQIYQVRDDELKVGRTYNLMGMSHLKHQEIAEDAHDDKALQCFDKAIGILKKNGVEGKEEFAGVLMNKGLAHDKIDEIDLALKCLRESYCHYCNIFGEEHLKVSVVLSKMGSSSIKDRNHVEAMTQLEEALQIRKQKSSDHDAITAEILFGLGIIHCENRNYDEAISSYEEAMKIRRETLGDDHVEVAHILLNVGSVFARNGEYERALVPWLHTIEMYKAAGLHDDHPKVKCALGNITIARNLATIAKHKTVEKSVRKLENY